MIFAPLIIGRHYCHMRGRTQKVVAAVTTVSVALRASKTGVKTQ